jgi:hypothetical protein
MSFVYSHKINIETKCFKSDDSNKKNLNDSNKKNLNDSNKKNLNDSNKKHYKDNNCSNKKNQLPNKNNYHNSEYYKKCYDNKILNYNSNKQEYHNKCYDNKIMNYKNQQQKEIHIHHHHHNNNIPSQQIVYAPIMIYNIM